MSNATRRPTGDAEPKWDKSVGLYTVRIELPLGPDGRRKRRKVSGHTEAECRLRANELRAQLATTGRLDSSTATVGDALDGYLRHVVVRRKPSTQDTYGTWIRLYVRPYLHTKLLGQLQPRDVTAWATALTMRGGEGGKPLCTWEICGESGEEPAGRVAIQWAVNEGLISHRRGNEGLIDLSPRATWPRARCIHARRRRRVDEEQVVVEEGQGALGTGRAGRPAGGCCAEKG